MEPLDITAPEYVRQRIRAAGFDEVSIDGEPREYEILRDVLTTVRTMRGAGASRDEIEAELRAWGDLTDWAVAHPATDPETGWSATRGR